MKSILELTTKNHKDESTGVIIITRIPRKNLKLYLDVQESLLYKWIENNLSVGNVIASEEGWDLLKKAAALVPTVDDNGTKSPLDLEVLDECDYDFYNNATRLFFTSSVDDEDFYTNPKKQYAASLLAQFNHIEYGDTLVKMAGKVQEKNQKELEEKEKKKKAKTKTETETEKT